ncbi:MAG: Branched-chain amino acid transport system permease protein LivM, partial [uncultured Acetobacteraceae bacterium]
GGRRRRAGRGRGGAGAARRAHRLPGVVSGAGDGAAGDGTGVPGGELPPVPAHLGGDLRRGDPGAQHRHGLQRPDLARPWRFLRRRRLHDGHPDGELRPALLGHLAGQRGRLRGARVGHRLPGAAARRALSRAHHLRPRRGGAASAETRCAGDVDGRRARRVHRQTGRAVRPAAERRPVDVPVHRGDRRGHFRPGPEPAAEPHRPRHDGDPRPAHGCGSDGHGPRGAEDPHLRPQRDHHRRRGRAERRRGGVRLARQLLRESVHHALRRHDRGRRRLHLRRGVRRPVRGLCAESRGGHRRRRARRALRRHPHPVRVRPADGVRRAAAPGGGLGAPNHRHQRCDTREV